MDKEYRPIPGFSKYGISIDGEVKHLRTGYIKKNCMNQNNKYYVVNLYDDNNKMCRPLVHRLVALTYLPNPNNLPQVNHKDENKLNNHRDNLEWCTAAYNNTYNDKAKKIGEKLKNQSSPLTGTIGTKAQKIAQIDPITKKIINIYPSAREASRQMNCASSTIRAVANHQQYCHTAKGFIWEWV